MKKRGSKSSKLRIKGKMSPAELARLLKETAAMEVAIQAAVRDALIQHKRAGNPIAVWKHDRVVWIPPEEIEIFDLPASQ